MKRIKHFIGLFSKLRNGENFEVHKTILKYLTRVISEFPFLAELFESYQEKVETLDAVFFQYRKFKESMELKEIDRKRKDSFLAIKQRVIAALYISLEDEHTAGSHLSFLFDNYKYALRRTYEERSAYFYEFIQSTRSDEYKADVEELNLKAAIDELEEFNELFEDTMEMRSDKKAYKKLLGDIKAARREADLVLKELADAINSLYNAYELTEQDLAKLAKLSTMIDKINGAITQFKDAYYARVDTKKPGDMDKPHKRKKRKKKPYQFKVASQTLIEEYTIHVIDKNPEGFRKHFADVSLKDCRIYFNYPGDEGKWDERPFVFEDFLYDAENKPEGIKLLSSQYVIGLVNTPNNYAMLCRDEDIIIHFEGFKDAMLEG